MTSHQLSPPSTHKYEQLDSNPQMKAALEEFWSSLKQI